jgi:hypothetical protein
MGNAKIWEADVVTSNGGTVKTRAIRCTDTQTNINSYAVEYHILADLLGIDRWLTLLGVNADPVPGVTAPSASTSRELLLKAVERAADASQRKHALLAQIASTTISGTLLTAIQAEVAAGEIT